jgi:hypothetical protein
VNLITIAGVQTLSGTGACRIEVVCPRFCPVDPFTFLHRRGAITENLPSAVWIVNRTAITIAVPTDWTWTDSAIVAAPDGSILLARVHN